MVAWQFFMAASIHEVKDVKLRTVTDQCPYTLIYFYAYHHLMLFSSFHKGSIYASTLKAKNSSLPVCLPSPASKKELFLVS